MSLRASWVALPGIIGLLAAPAVGAAEPVRPGLKPGQRPGPYSALVAVGPQRGQQHCFVCEAADKPVVIVFARTLSEPLGALVKRLDAALATHKAADLRVWVTVLADDPAGRDREAVTWARKHAVGNVPVGVFEDPVGPPAYLLSPDADVTVLLSVKQRVVAAFAYRPGEMTAAAADAVMAAVPRLVEKK